MKKLNLGCGYDIRKGWINLDIKEGRGVDIVHDLNTFPYPFKDNYFDEINADNIFEHLQNPKLFIDELWRISKNNGFIHISTTHFSNWASWGDITHVRPFNSTSLDHVRNDRKYFNLLDDSKVCFVVKPYLKVNFILNPIINLKNATRCIFERTLCKIFSVKELIFDLEVKK